MTGSPRRRLAAVLRAVTLVALTSPSTWANGRFPRGSQVVFDAADARHLVVTTTFGFIESRDGGAHFDWKCESALGLGGETDMMLAIPASGATVLATFNGVFTTMDGCSFDAPEGSRGIIPDLTLSASERHRLFAFDLVGLGEGLFDSRVLRSDDSGGSWGAVSALPRDLLPLTIDVAPSDARRLYVSARQGSASDFSSVLLRSDDAGATFELSPIPETSGQRMAYIAGVNPRDADDVWLRADDPQGTVIWHSADAGRTFQRSMVGRGRLLGFAFSPDGARVVVGGPTDGLWLSSNLGLDWTMQSSLGPSCLGWAADALYACADAAVAGFSLGVSRDAGASFEPRFSFNQLCGSTSCAGGTPIAAMCPTEWEIIEPALAPTCVGAFDAGSSGPRPPASEDADGCQLSAGAQAARVPCSLCVVALVAYARRHRGLRSRASRAGLS